MRGGHIHADQQDWGICMKAFQKRGKREQITGAGGGENGGGMSAAPREAVRRKRGCLLVSHDPMLEVWLLSEGIINGDVVNAWDAETRRDAIPQQGLDYCLATSELTSTEHRTGIGERFRAETPTGPCEAD